MKILGIIPARGGSKGILNKNRKLLRDKPLLQYTTEAALGSKLIDKLIFSSEDAVLIKIAKKLGVEVPFVRPKHLATDDAGSLEVVQHVIQSLSDKGENFDAICLLQVTTPFRSSEDIDNAIKKFKIANTDSLISVQKVPHQYNPHWVFVTNKGKGLNIATGDSKIIKRRQDLPKTYIRDGAIYITKTNVIVEENSFFGNSISYFESDSKNHVNIDTMQDWKRAEEIAKRI